jgi:hypothetical protein
MTRFGTPVFWVLAASATAIAVLAGAVLFYFDPSRYGFYPICLFHSTTGLLCPACGSLRALHQLLHGHLAAAFHLNPLLVVALPMVVWYAADSAARMRRNEPVRAAISKRWIWLIVAIGAAVSVWRNIPGSPFALLAR